MSAARTPEEIRQSIEANREQLGIAFAGAFIAARVLKRIFD